MAVEGLSDTHWKHCWRLLKNKRMRIEFIIVLLLSFNICRAQNDIETLKLRATLKVLDDFTDYYFLKKGDGLNLDSIKLMCNVKVLQDTDHLENCIILEVTPTGCNCQYLLAYDQFFKLFYKLSGFKVSEFTVFFNRVLRDNFHTPFVNGNRYNDRQFLKYLKGNVAIKGIDWALLYKEYYGKPLNCLFDKKSCSNQRVIVMY